jgi:hypothetical protein
MSDVSEWHLEGVGSLELDIDLAHCIDIALSRRNLSLWLVFPARL